MGSTQQGQAVVEMVLVGSFKELERQTERSIRKSLNFSETLRKEKPQ